MSTALSPVSYPACFTGMNLDQVNEHLRQGLATKADAAALVEWWNKSGKRFTTATLGQRTVCFSRLQMDAPYISISN